MIKLIPLPRPGARKSQYIIKLKFMHGDADHFDHSEVILKNEKEFLKCVKLLENKPECTGAGGTKWEKWCEKEGSIFDVPYDVTYSDIHADIDDWELFHIDDNGVKWGVEIE